MSHHNHSRSDRIVALDLGDRCSVLARRQGPSIVHEELPTTPETLRARLADEPPCTVVLEAGSQSPWIAWLLAELGHRPVVVLPRRVRLITESARKTDRSDAEWLLRLAEADPALLCPVRIRSRSQQADLARLRTRRLLKDMRMMAIQSVRSQAKLFGCALPSGGAAAFARRAQERLPAELRSVCGPLLQQIEQLTASIQLLDRQLASIATQRYPESAALSQVPGIGTLTALTFVLTLQSPQRFERSRDVGPAVGLVPKKRASGQRDPELRITKQGDGELRRLLVLAAHRLMRASAPDSDLKRFGERLAARGGKNAKKRAVVAVARKLAVVLVALWKTGEVYQPLRADELMAAA